MLHWMEDLEEGIRCLGGTFEFCVSTEYIVGLAVFRIRFDKGGLQR